MGTSWAIKTYTTYENGDPEATDAFKGMLSTYTAIPCRLSSVKWWCGDKASFCGRCYYCRARYKRVAEDRVVLFVDKQFKLGSMLDRVQML